MILTKCQLCGKKMFTLFGTPVSCPKCGSSIGEKPSAASSEDRIVGLTSMGAEYNDDKETRNRGNVARRTGEYVLGKEVIDYRSEWERRVEEEARAGISLGTDVDALVQELIEIGRSDGYTSKPGGKFDQSGNHIRAREIGKVLNEKGGNDLMVEAAYRVGVEVRRMRDLERCWEYIGKWLP